MKTLTTLEIVIIVIVAVVGLFFLLNYLGIISGPQEWFRKSAIKNQFCSEILTILPNCNNVEYSSSEVGNLIDKDDTSKNIRKRDVGAGTTDEAATYGEVCKFLGYGTNIITCLRKACGCKIK